MASAPISDASILKSLIAPTVVDARDQSEVDGCKGGERIENSIHVPFNIDGQKQTDRPTTMPHTKQHTTHNAQRTTHNAQRTTHNAQRTTHNAQHTTHNTQHTTHNTQHTTHNTQHTTHNTQHTTHNTQHTTHNTQHTTNNEQRTTNNEQQTTNNKQQTTNNKQQTTTHNWLWLGCGGGGGAGVGWEAGAVAATSVVPVDDVLVQRLSSVSPTKASNRSWEPWVANPRLEDASG